MHIHTYVSSFIHKHAFSIGIFGVLFGFTFLAGGFVAANGQTVGPDDSHIVSLYIDGEETVLPTRAQTVGELLDKTDVLLTEYDLVEPVKETRIDTDNFTINVYRARPVSIVDGQSVTRLFTPYEGPKLIAEKAGIAVYPEDTYTFESGDSFVDEQIIGEKIVINRATPVVINLYGAGPVIYRTHTNTVGELLAEKGIVPEQGATLTPAVDTPLTENLGIFISKFGKQVVTEDVVIPFAINSTPDPNAPFGRVTVLSAGKPGVKKVTYEIETRDGREVARNILQEVQVAEPITQIQTKGTKATVSGDKVEWMRAAGIPEDQFAAVDFIIGHESGWRPNAMSSRGCGGLGQACPASKLANVCPDWQIDPVCQLRFFNGYAVSRYGSWTGAYNFWLANHWW